MITNTTYHAVSPLPNYIINPCVFDASSRVLSSVPHPHNDNERWPSAHSSCRSPHCRSPTPPIVPSYSAPRQHAPLAVSLLCESRTLLTAPPGRDNRLPLHTASSQPAASSISATKEEVGLPQLPSKRQRRRQWRHLPYVVIILVLAQTK